MRFKAPLPWIVMLSAVPVAHTHTHASKFPSSQGRVNNPTPVLSDTCFRALSQSEQRGKTLCGHEINLGPALGKITTLDSSVCHCSSLLQLTQIGRQNRGELKLKGTYSGGLVLETWPKRLSKFWRFLLSHMCYLLGLCVCFSLFIFFG